MLYISLFLSLILLISAYVAAQPQPHSVRWAPFVVSALVTIVGPFLIGLFPTVVAIQAAFLTMGLAAWPRLRQRIRSSVLLLASTVAAYGLATWIALGSVAKYDKLREQYPYESMEERVPMPSSEAPEVVASDPVVFQLAGLEGRLDGGRSSSRRSSLWQLHERRVDQFVRSPGFGMARMISPEWGLRTWPPRFETPDQPDMPAASAKPAELPLSATDEPDLLDLHQAGILNFAYPEGFGFVKNRQHVAGFLPHGFSEVPSSAPRWTVERIELVGLLLHPEPIAYVSQKLPAMAELRGAPTRSLDEFEATALRSIQKGETLAVGMHNDRARMLGAIRSARQCVECHGGERGDLLGAFSYTLRTVIDKP